MAELVQSLVGGKAGLDTEDKGRQRERAYDLVRQSMAKGLVGGLKIAVFDHVLGLARSYVPLREDQRFYWQQTLAAMREVFLMMGEGLAADGLLKERVQIFFATKDEIEAHVKGVEDFPAHEVWRREKEFRLLQGQHQLASPRAYPTFLVGNRPLDVHAEQGQVLVGRPVSPGLKQGPVKVVGSPRQLSKVRSGDILVTGSTDPAWTPIFGLVGGLIMERGGQLSHGAVVAREYGLPAVTGIAGVTQRLRDGQVVVLDGLAGTVTLLN
jgi:pyruvate,water dikinase